MEEVELLCNRVAIVDQGRIIAMDTIKNLIARLGGGVIHVGVQKVDDALLAELAGLPAVSEATLLPKPAVPTAGDGKELEVPERELFAGGSVIKIVARNSQQAVVSVISLLNDRDIPLTSLEILEPNLESVFLHLTGKKLRE
jgi:ABC-2 type transport system ATP-binding protein